MGPADYKYLLVALGRLGVSLIGQLSQGSKWSARCGTQPSPAEATLPSSRMGSAAYPWAYQQTSCLFAGFSLIFWYKFREGFRGASELSIR